MRIFYEELKMKYYLLEYLDINCENISIKEKKAKEKQWENACLKYNEYIVAHKDSFSNSFLKEYFNGGFHDYKILQIKSEFTDSGKLNIIVELSSKNTIFLLISTDVIEFSISVDNQKRNILNSYYLYGEYFIDAKGYWNHNFLFGNGCESNIIAKKFIFKKRKN